MALNIKNYEILTRSRNLVPTSSNQKITYVISGLFGGSIMLQMMSILFAELAGSQNGSFFQIWSQFFQKDVPLWLWW